MFARSSGHRTRTAEKLLKSLDVVVERNMFPIRTLPRDAKPQVGRAFSSLPCLSTPDCLAVQNLARLVRFSQTDQRQVRFAPRFAGFADICYIFARVVCWM